MDDPLRQAKAKAAATYDAAVDHFDDEPLTFWDRIGRRTVERLALSLSAQVLDVGCGTGASALPAAQAVGPSGRVVGVDLSARLPRQGGRARLTDVEFRIGDMTSSGYPDQSFDADRGADQSGQCHWLKENKVDRLETNAIYAIGRKPS